jgi:catechol 2,3-dioxygenase-like lactoylglutathione lyase family enzyme
VEEKPGRYRFGRYRLRVGLEAVMGGSIGTLTATVLDAPDPNVLANFYQRLLGWAIRSDDPTWVTLRPANGGAGLSFQLEENFVAPTWPSVRDKQQMMMHLDIEVDDLDAAGEQAIAAGATLAEFQPQDDTRVFLDPAGHPFCLWMRTG